MKFLDKIVTECTDLVKNFFEYLKRIRDVLLGLDEKETMEILDKLREVDAEYFKQGKGVTEVKMRDINGKNKDAEK